MILRRILFCFDFIRFFSCLQLTTLAVALTLNRHTWRHALTHAWQSAYTKNNPIQPLAPTRLILVIKIALLLYVVVVTHQCLSLRLQHIFSISFLCVRPCGPVCTLNRNPCFSLGCLLHTCILCPLFMQNLLCFFLCVCVCACRPLGNCGPACVATRSSSSTTRKTLM